MRIKAAILAGAMALGTSAATSAQGPIVGAGNLVNVQIGYVDVIDNVDVVVRDITVNVNAAVRIAANVCGVAVGVIGDDLVDGNATCRTLDAPIEFVNITQ